MATLVQSKIADECGIAISVRILGLLLGGDAVHHSYQANAQLQRFVDNQVADDMILSVQASIEGSELSTYHSIVLHTQHVDIICQAGTSTQVHGGSIMRPPGKFISIAQLEPSVLGRSQEVGIQITAH